MTQLHFTLNNQIGSSLKWRKFGHKGSQHSWNMTYIDSESNLLKGSKKIQLPLLGLWNSGSNEHLIAADFDLKNFGHKLSADALLAQIHTQLWDICESYTTFMTPSGGIKALFWVAFQENCTIRSYTTPTDAWAKMFLLKRLGHELTFLLDLSPAALKSVFMNRDIAQNISGFLAGEGRTSFPLQVGLNKGAGRDLHAVSNSGRKGLAQTTEGGSPALFDTLVKHHPTLRNCSEELWNSVSEHIISRYRSNNFTAILKILLATPALLRKPGFGLSITKIASDLGCSHTVVSRCLKQLVEDGILCKENEGKYIPGVKATMYTAGGWLWTALRNAYPKHTPSQVLTQGEAAANVLNETEVRSGEFNSLVLKLVHKFSNIEDFVDHLGSLKGLHSKRGRVKEAVAIAKWHYRRKAKSHGNILR